MAEKPNKTIVELVARWRERLDLQHWTIDVGVMHEEEFGGSCSIYNGRFKAIVKIAPDETFEETRLHVVHELLHVLLSDNDQAVLELEKAGVFNGQGWAVFHSQWVRQMELGVDHLTRLFLAMPHWKDDDLDPAKADRKKR